MDDATRIELDAAVEEYLSAHRAVLQAGRGYFERRELTPDAREAWRSAMTRATLAAERLRAIEARIGDEPAALAYLRDRLARAGDATA